MRLRQHLILLLRWHRRIALMAAVFLILLALTGVLINHSPDFGLDHREIRASWLADWYGIETPPPVAFDAAGRWLIHDGLNTLTLDGNRVGNCQSPLHGALVLQDSLLALCDEELLIIEPGGEVLERITTLFGLPKQATAIGLDQGRLLIKAAQGVFLADLDRLEWQPTALPPGVIWAKAGQPPPSILSDSVTDVPGISLERVLLDLHSGRFFGSGGVLIFDLMALFFIFVAVSGGWAWINYLRLKKKESKRN